jgi:hypothetical protein
MCFIPIYNLETWNMRNLPSTPPYSFHYLGPTVTHKTPVTETDGRSSTQFKLKVFILFLIWSQMNPIHTLTARSVPHISIHISPYCSCGRSQTSKLIRNVCIWRPISVQFGRYAPGKQYDVTFKMTAIFIVTKARET